MVKFKRKLFKVFIQILFKMLLQPITGMAKVMKFKKPCLLIFVKTERESNFNFSIVFL